MSPTTRRRVPCVCFSRAHAAPGNAWAFQTPRGCRRSSRNDEAEPGLPRAPAASVPSDIGAKLNSPLCPRRILLIRLQKGAVASCSCNSWIVGVLSRSPDVPSAGHETWDHVIARLLNLVSGNFRYVSVNLFRLLTASPFSYCRRLQ